MHARKSNRKTRTTIFILNIFVLLVIALVTIVSMRTPLEAERQKTRQETRSAFLAKEAQTGKVTMAALGGAITYDTEANPVKHENTLEENAEASLALIEQTAREAVEERERIEAERIRAEEERARQEEEERQRQAEEQAREIQYITDKIAEYHDAMAIAMEEAPNDLSLYMNQMPAARQAYEAALALYEKGAATEKMLNDSKALMDKIEAAFERDTDIVAVTVYNEGWCGTTEEHKQLIAAVIINRMLSKHFPNTVYDIVTAPAQYIPAYADMSSVYAREAMKDADIWEHCKEIARLALTGQIDAPRNMVYQANFPQGSGTYKTFDTSYSTTWFCYMSYDD